MSGSNSSSPIAAAATPPEQPLGLTVHSLPEPALDATDRRWPGRVRMLLVLLVCSLPVLASYFMYYVVRPEGGGSAYSDLIDPVVPVPAAQATDLQGRPVPLSTLKGQWLLIVVAPAACGSDCEKRLYMQRQLREMTGRERDRIDKLWLVTDEAPVAAPLAEALAATPAMHMLRLKRDALAAWLKPAPGHALEDHLYLVDPRGDWMMRAPADAQPARLKRDLDRLLRASASWDRAGR